MSAQLRPWIGKPPHSELPALTGYEAVRREGIPLARLALLGLLLIPVWAVIFLGAMSLFGGRTSFTFTVSILFVIGVVAVVVTTTVLHEAIHGLAALLTGQRPAFGMGKGFFYTTIHDSVSWGQYLVIALSPGIVIGAGSIAGALIWPEATGWLLFASLFNASGVGGDLWMASRVLATPRDARFFDLADGFAIYMPERDPTPQP